MHLWRRAGKLQNTEMQKYANCKNPKCTFHARGWGHNLWCKLGGRARACSTRTPLLGVIWVDDAIFNAFVSVGS